MSSDKPAAEFSTFNLSALCQTADEAAELTDAGWEQFRASVWLSPWGKLYRGPHYAYQVMHSAKQWGLKRCTDCGEVSSAGGTIEHAKTCTKGDLAIETLIEGILL